MAEPMTDREKVLAKFPQARYLNLSDKTQCHCIDDDYNDRYLAYARVSRRAAWRAAARAVLAQRPTRRPQS